MPNGRCRMHGGMALKGIAHPAFKDGSRCGSIPGRMAGRYEELLNDPLIADNRVGIALMQARVEDLLTRVDHGESGELWQALQGAWVAVEQSVNAERSSTIDRLSEAVRDTDNAVESLGLLLQQGGQDFQTWKEIRETEEQRRKAADSQTKREYAASVALTPTQQMALLGAVAALLRMYVRDPRDLADASRRLEALAVRPERNGQSDL